MSDDELIMRARAGEVLGNGSRQIAALLREVEKLRNALALAREASRERGVTTREFAALCGISAVELSRWTSADNSGPPDFID